MLISITDAQDIANRIMAPMPAQIAIHAACFVFTLPSRAHRLVLNIKNNLDIDRRNPFPRQH